MKSLCFGFALLAACAAPQKQPAQAGAPGQTQASEDPNSGTVECHDETPTGSNISHQVCREKKSGAHDDVNSDTMQHQMEGPQRAAPQRGN